ncbi:MAG: CaiB/BaiF CoA transferase family protein [Sandaracinaceae bacterium]
MSPPGARPLEGLRVLELGQLLAGPWAGTILAYLGADVIKVEPPSGDPIRSWRVLDETGTSYWWRSIARNKRCITIDLRTDDGRALARRLALGCDVLIENFRPGTLERWGLGPDALHAESPGLVIARISGYGQDGPLRDRPGYASVAEAAAGLRYVTGTPGEVPVRSNLSLGDTLAGLHTAIGILAALRERDRSGRGQVIDCALTESVLSVLEAVIPEAAGAGVIREPSGPTITGVVPSNVYPCSDGARLVIAANGASLFVRLMRAIGREDLASDPSLKENPGRVARASELDGAIADWTRVRTKDEVVAAMVNAEVPCAPIQNAQDLLRDPQLLARGAFEVLDGVTVSAIAPKLGRTPGGTEWTGRAIGADTDEVLGELGLDEGEIAELRRRGVV